MSQVVSTRLSQETAERLKRLARQLGKTPSETSAMLIEESLRENEFACIEFRNSTLGRQAYLKNSSLAVWEVIAIARSYKMDEVKVATHFQRPIEWVKAAFNYAEAYSEEIGITISDAQSTNATTLKRLLPQLEIVNVPVEILGEGID